MFINNYYCLRKKRFSFFDLFPQNLKIFHTLNVFVLKLKKKKKSRKCEIIFLEIAQHFLVCFIFIFKTKDFIFNLSAEEINYFTDYGIASYNNRVVCINFICKWRDLQFNVDFERQIFKETFLEQVYLTFRVFARKYAKKKSPKKYFLIFVSIPDLEYEHWLYIQ